MEEIEHIVMSPEPVLGTKHFSAPVVVLTFVEIELAAKRKEQIRRVLARQLGGASKTQGISYK